MLPILGVSTTYLLIDMALALVALTIGFFSAIWYQRNVVGVVQNTAAPSGAAPANEPAPEAIREKEAAENEAERASMAAMQLRDLAMNVATEIGEHNTMIADISGNLNNLEEGAEGASSVVMDAVAQMLSANDKLQSRLADAEQKIQTQADEIRTKQSEACTDVLTKLPNRRAFDDAMASNSKAFAGQKRPFSLLIFDVDHFKKFNDTHGHQAGDEVLRQVGQTMSAAVKGEDIPCRYGGEEFALVMPNTKIDQARIAAERVRQAVEAMEVEFEGKMLKVTASIGVAEVATGEDSAVVVRRADDAVYAAKEAGRNRSYWQDGERCRSVEDTATAKPTSSAGQVSETSTQEAVKPVDFSSLPDQAVFSGELHRRINESHRFGAPLSVMYLGINDFVSLEEEYGNAVGKLLLESVAQFIRSTLRDMDLLGKLSNGEFIVMLPGSTEQEAKLVGNRVEEAVASCVIPLGGKNLRLGISQAVTEVKPDDEAATMIARAKTSVNQQVEATAGVS